MNTVLIYKVILKRKLLVVKTLEDPLPLIWILCLCDAIF